MGNYGYDSKHAVGENRVVQLTDAKPVLYTDEVDTVAHVKLAYLPKGAWILDVLIQVETAFNDSGTDTIEVGVIGSTASYLAATSVAATGMIVASHAGTPLVPAARLTADSWIVAVYRGQNNNASAGKAVISIVWAPCQEEPVL
jgi:hypothetical protein